jgi:hypothetical protein
MNHCSITKEDILDSSNGRLYSDDEKKIISFDSINFSPHIIPISLYEDWLKKNETLNEWTRFSEVSELTFMNLNQFEEYQEKSKWSVFYQISFPGIFENLAMIQLTAYCPAGPPNYGSIYLLESKNKNWNVVSNFGLYNQ